MFFAFYTMRQTAIELRSAPFIGWIHDLSGPDPYYVVACAVGPLAVHCAVMTPAAGMDPAQQKMMLFMPLVMGFLFIQSPAGALLYWLVSGVPHRPDAAHELHDWARDSVVTRTAANVE